MRTTVVLIAALLAGCVGGITDLGEGPADPAAPDAQTFDAKAVFRQWSGCMTMANFQTASMKTAWSTLTTNDGKQCLNCHDQGAYNFIASDDETAFFTGLSQHSYFLSMYFTVNPATKKIEINTGSFNAANTAVGHPRFNTTSNQGLTALTTFHAATAANTACETPRMLD
jgi:hypothetical protein